MDGLRIDQDVRVKSMMAGDKLKRRGLTTYVLWEVGYRRGPTVKHERREY